MQPNDILLVLCNCPNSQSAAQIAQKLVEENLAACVTQHAPCRSTYRWHGEITHSDEVSISIKTTVDVYPQVEARIHELHPYSVPEILAFPAAFGLTEYIEWIGQEAHARRAQNHEDD